MLPHRNNMHKTMQEQWQFS